MILAAISSFCALPTCQTLNQSRNRYPSHSRKVFCESNQVLNPHNSITHETRKKCECFDLYKELIPYKEAWSWQKRIVKEKKALIERNAECPDTLTILQHSPLYTMGTGSSEEYLNFDIKDPPSQLYRTERGGGSWPRPGAIAKHFSLI